MHYEILVALFFSSIKVNIHYSIRHRICLFYYEQILVGYNGQEKLVTENLHVCILPKSVHNHLH